MSKPVNWPHNEWVTVGDPIAGSGPSANVFFYNNGSALLADRNQCYCLPWYYLRGTEVEREASNAADWIAFAISVIFLMYYAYATYRATCGWEEVYVCTVELIKVTVDQFLNTQSPATLYLDSGNRVLWIRYGEWLLTCPVILIHLSNITGLKDDYNKRTMKLLVSDIGTIVWGVTCAAAKGYVKIIFFIFGLIYGANTFFHAAKVYVESYHTVPKGFCRNMVRCMAWMYYVSWGMFPVLFVLGPEGFNHMNLYQSNIAHTVVDLMSKNFWGMMGHILRLKIHEHILIHGDLRKTQKIMVAGEEMEVETMLGADEVDEATVKHPTKDLANRESFLIMRDRLKEKGFEVRASLEASGAPDMENKKGMGMGMGMGMGGAPEPGRVILAVPDITMVDFFREQFASLPVMMELVPALGVDTTIQIVQQAMPLGGCDFVLCHPEFLRDTSANGLVARLRSMNQRVCAFGWAKAGPIRDLIEQANIDGWLEGPSFGSAINREQLVQLIANMQQRKKAAAAALMGGMGMGGMGMNGMGGMGNGMGSGMSNGMSGMGMMGMGGMNGMGSMNNGMGNGMGGTNNGMGSGMSMNGSPMGGMAPQSPSRNTGAMMGGMYNQNMAASNAMGMNAANSARVGTNPLFNTAPSPLNSQLGAAGGGNVAMQPMSPMAGTQQSASASGTPRGNVNEAEMLQQLMSEITRLRSELGEH